MIWQTSFRELRNHVEIGHEILRISKGLDAITEKVYAKNWIYATLDDNQILEEDAQNLSLALEDLNVKSVYGCWISSMTQNNGFDFDVVGFDSDRQSIENSQNLDSCWLDADDSYMFNDGELRFLIIRPDSNRWPLPYTLIMAGSKSFIERACCADGWILHDGGG